MMLTGPSSTRSPWRRRAVCVDAGQEWRLTATSKIERFRRPARAAEPVNSPAGVSR